MLGDDARRIAAGIEEYLNASACQGVKVTVKSEEMSPETIPAGAGRPTFISYFIQIDDVTRRATLTLGQAATLLNEIEPDWAPDRLFEAIRDLDAPIEDTN
jgi:ABC-type ATPase involved in cell division